MARHEPAVVIRLTISADVAHSRKPDHDLAELSDKILVMDRLHFNGARLIDIDATMPYPKMLKAALDAINDVQGSAG